VLVVMGGQSIGGPKKAMTVRYLNEKHKVMFLEHNSLRPYENFNSGNIHIFTVATKMNSCPGAASDYILLVINIQTLSGVLNAY
jgi:hypothetical protein